MRIRTSRVMRRLVRVVLALVVCSGLFVMHGLDDPSVHAGAIHVEAHRMATGSHPVEASHRFLGDVVDGRADSDDHCTACTGAIHVVVVCLAVLATVALALQWRSTRLAAAAGTVGEPSWPVVAAPTLKRVARPAWVRLAVMLC